MRFLLVYQDLVPEVMELLAELKVADVEVIKVAKRQKEIEPDQFVRVSTAGGVCALIQVDREYKNSVAKLNVEHNFKKFRSKDQILRAWLVPTPPADHQPLEPMAAFEKAKEDCEWLVFSDTALVSANDIAPLRWGFANRAAALLRRLACGEDLGAMRNWRADYNVDFAANGRVRCVYHVPDHPHSKKTEWHLKDGDNTTADAAARVYFNCHPVNRVNHVLVLYVGPHPPDGDLNVSLGGATWAKSEPPRDEK